MEESPPRVSRKDWPKSGPTRKKNSCRYAVDDGGDLIECSGKYCRSCTAGLIADCVALCCCPCAVLNILAFAFVKIPYMVGRRCLGLGKKKEKMKRKCKEVEGGFVVERDGNLMIKKESAVEEGMLETVSSEFGEDQEQMGDSSDSARFEAEKIWLELYQIGHLGFGRVSFSGIQSMGKCS
ncbi:Chromo domain-containing protein isoform 1 [Melia azedarach]|uniref:Chromo domain-containing protein isoform 1 n=1 Tax=Melia azedarach TaxID=155640 RepID=A0ACC1Z002_MELAZ|nr:Chromo domain-containing protein isoform 1 [Melia azedarach]